jgi:hypothetical protein
VKNKIYAISLLLSFLVILSHELMPHHHHDMALIISGRYEHDDERDHHHDKEDHHQHDSQDEEENSERNHPFPFHQHISATNDFVYARTNLHESNSLNKVAILFVVSVVFNTDFFDPPGPANNSYRNKPFLITSLFNPEAYALRGPPSIA